MSGRAGSAYVDTPIARYHDRSPLLRVVNPSAVVENVRKNRLLITLAAISVVALSTSMLMAAEPKGDDPLATPGGDEDLASLSIDEMSERGSGLVRRMEKQLAESFKLLEESIAAGDVPRMV